MKIMKISAIIAEIFIIIMALVTIVQKKTR